MIITVGGMGLVFLSLAIILLVIIILNRLFSPQEANPGPLSLAEVGEPQEDPELVAAISAALAILAEEERVGKAWKAPVVAPTSGASLWKAAVWPQLLDARDFKGRKW
jgi:Na+-transporting methylmalonyl-CoA/oxaloacetate decarboxylase gamma subunit